MKHFIIQNLEDITKITTAKETSTINESLNEVRKARRDWRSIDNFTKKINDHDDGVNDLQVEESKVFRPLFVYRYQMAKRLKNPNKKFGVNKRINLYRYPAYLLT